jgi:hypothetical protein
MEQFKIIDNFLNVNDFVKIKEVLTGSNFPWFFQPAVAETQHTNYSDFYFAHQLFNADSSTPSSYFEICKPIIEKLQINKLIRIKANLYPNLGYELENKPHTDFPFSHTGSVFYINSNNGYTILEDGTKIESVENRILIFDASKMHQSTHCTDTKVRININLNYF